MSNGGRVKVEEVGKLAVIGSCRFVRLGQSGRPMKYVLFSLFAMLMLLLSSCKIDGEEEITIHEDGSSRVAMRYELPGVFLSQETADELVAALDKSLGHHEHINLLTNRVDLVAGQRIIHLVMNVDSEADLSGLRKSLKSGHPESGEGKSKSNKLLNSIVGNVEARTTGLSVELSRQVNLQPLLDEYVGKKSSSLLGDFEFRYILHLPRAAEQNNAHKVTDGGKTLKWTYLLREMKNKPITMNVTAPIPIPWWVYALVTVAGCAVLALIYWLVKKLR